MYTGVGVVIVGAGKTLRIMMRAKLKASSVKLLEIQERVTKDNGSFV